MIITLNSVLGKLFYLLYFLRFCLILSFRKYSNIHMCPHIAKFVFFFSFFFFSGMCVLSLNLGRRAIGIALWDPARNSSLATRVRCFRGVPYVGCMHLFVVMGLTAAGVLGCGCSLTAGHKFPPCTVSAGTLWVGIGPDIGCESQGCMTATGTFVGSLGPQCG